MHFILQFILLAAPEYYCEPIIDYRWTLNLFNFAKVQPGLPLPFSPDGHSVCVFPGKITFA
jgi:hypothetical protein